ncbi:MBL fold metallo-hydrolase [Helicovermis profundi]|uniref:MBL fold metallo-hydrolase n=1 Tax=Helicovermis profundi TaxID=3065157 RepID=A0AAU9ESK3_9FIRM|nr:MBL fold metallo-hydrolase [Clostridia bacterium S502]
MGIEFCSLASGSSGNCQYIGTDKTGILLDAGLTGKYIKNALYNIGVDPLSIEAVLITHEHSDHVKAVGILMRKFGYKLYITEKTYEQVKLKIGKIDESKVIIIKKNDAFFIGDVNVKTYEVSHDAVDPIGYTFAKDNNKISVVTDLGVVTKYVLGEVKNSDLLLVESNHDKEMLMVGSYPYYLKKRIVSDDGHLSNEAAGELIKETVLNGNVKNVLLGHLSRENNFPELALKTVKNILEENNIIVGKDVNLDMTYRDKVSRFYKINKE